MTIALPPERARESHDDSDSPERQERQSNRRRKLGAVVAVVAVGASAAVLMLRGGGESSEQTSPQEEGRSEEIGSATPAAEFGEEADEVRIKNPELEGYIPPDAYPFNNPEYRDIVDYIDGSRELTDEEVDTIVSELGFDPEFAEGFVSGSLQDIQFSLDGFPDEIEPSGFIPFIGHEDHLGFGIQINADGGPPRLVDPFLGQRFIDHEGNPGYIEDPDVALQLLRGGMQANNQNGDTQENPDTDANEDGLIGSDMERSPLFDEIMSQKETLNPDERFELSLVLYEEYTGEKPIRGLIMSQNTNLDFYLLSVNKAFSAAIEHQDPRILWSVYEDVFSNHTDLSYGRIEEAMLNGSTTMAEEVQDLINNARAFESQGVLATLTLEEAELELFYNGTNWQIA